MSHNAISGPISDDLLAVLMVEGGQLSVLYVSGAFYEI
jgi:hypothetical protein